MNLFETLKQFKRIEPDPAFSEKSKRMILAMPQETRPAIAVRGALMFLHTIETAAALALAGFFILLATGSFSGTKYLAPVQYSVIDPGSLHAEADAIDTQIQLANVSYTEVSSTVMGSTAAMAGGTGPVVARVLAAKGKTAVAAAGTPDHATSSASSTEPAPLSVDQALQQLSQ